MPDILVLYYSVNGAVRSLARLLPAASNRSMA
jgi:hypothetical protein